jgi:hypothetical protein
LGCVLDDFESTLLNLEGDGIARVRKGGEVRLSPLRSRLEASTIGITQKLRSWSRAGLVNSKDPMVAVAGDRWQDVQQLVLAVVHTVILVHFLYLEYTLYAFVILNLHTVRVIINHTGSKSYNLTLNLS